MNNQPSPARLLGLRSDEAPHAKDLCALAAEAAEVGLWWFDPTADRLDGTSTFRGILLGHHSAEERHWPLTGADFVALLHPDDRELMRKQVGNALASGEGARLKATFRLHHSGSSKSVRLRATGKVGVQEPTSGVGERRYLVGSALAETSGNHPSPGIVTDGKRLEAILNTMPQMVWSTRPDGYHDYFNDRWYEFTGMPYGSTDGEAWNGMFHPDDQSRAWERWRRSLDTGEPYEVEYRLRRHDGEYRWTLGRALPIRRADGTIERWFGTCTDIHDLKSSEEQRELISRELSHRIKNIFAVVSSLVTLTSRKDDAVRPFAAGLVQRLNSLAHAHEYIQPHNPWDQADPLSRTVLGLLRILVRPYMHEQDGNTSPGSASVRCTISGDDAPVGAGAGTALALIIHELATNAVKYGSLARAEGQVSMRGEILPDSQFRLTWQERGGPAITSPPTYQGFGTLLAYRGATGQLGAVIEQDWAEEGLTVRLTVPLVNLAR
jgi:PAS domain S-box-containing protein